MKISSVFVNFSLLKKNPDFCKVFIARTISILGLGMLSVAVPIQMYSLSGDSFYVGLAMALDGVGMFLGLLLGGVLADRYDRKKLILFARFVCGVGFLGLAMNAWMPLPSIIVLLMLSVWDGFFGALGVTALMACMPMLVGRENILQARAISMVTVRLATVISPAIGGVIIANSNVAWTYMIAAIGTGVTLLPLMGLPKMQAEGAQEQHPVRALLDGFRFLLSNRVVAGASLIGTLVTFTTAIRALFPALAEHAFGGGALEVGMMYSAVPLGATAGAIVSGWVNHLRRPGLVMMQLSLAAFLCMILLGVNQEFVLTLLLLAVFGYLVSIVSLIQYAIVQGHTPDHYLGRINGLWTAQDAAGDSLGAMGMGWLAKSVSSLASIAIFGASAMLLGLLMCAGFQGLRIASYDGAKPE